MLIYFYIFIFSPSKAAHMRDGESSISPFDTKSETKFTFDYSKKAARRALPPPARMVTRGVSGAVRPRSVGEILSSLDVSEWIHYIYLCVCVYLIFINSKRIYTYFQTIQEIESRHHNMKRINKTTDLIIIVAPPNPHIAQHYPINIQNPKHSHHLFTTVQNYQL
jgi:hypothetical protein